VRRRLGLRSGYLPPEPDFDRWAVAAADEAYYDKRYSGEEAAAILGLKPRKPRKEWRRVDGAVL
jgi:hypothetical protein